MRECGECQLCCRLLPAPDRKKPANERCQHQRFRKGCAIYETRPSSCRMWSCRWLIEDDTADLKRPDRAGYVIDLMPDFVTLQQHGETIQMEVVQVWIDPRRPDAHRDPDFRAYVERRAAEKILTIIRFGSQRGLTLIAPALTNTGEWIETEGQRAPEHTAAEIVTTLATLRTK